MSLGDLFTKYGSDKQSTSGYGPMYEEALKGVTVRAVLEIGVRHGYSLLAWAEAFPEAEIYGVDNEAQDITPIEACRTHPKIHLIQADSTKPETRNFLPPLQRFDLIVDDGSHLVEDQRATLATFRPLLATKGVYVIEDITSDFNARRLLAAVPPKGYRAKTLRTVATNDYDNRVVIVQCLF
jgi:cephalosporin hydroxylase